MKKLMTLVISATLMMSLTACENMSNQDVGVLAGGAVGGAVGSLFGSGSGQVLAAVGGTVAGAVIGGAIGRNMDRVDEMRMNQAIENNRINQATSWRNPDNGNRYTVKPTRTFYRNNRPCRDFTTHARIGGKRETIHGTACRDRRGRWRVVR